MRLPVQAIHSFQHCCLEDTDRIWSFMEDKTAEELRSNHSICVLESLRSNLRLQFGRMSLAWRDHNPGDGNVDTNVLARLNTIVESTRIDVDHVLRTSGNKISHKVLWRPDIPDPSDPDTFPEPYWIFFSFFGFNFTQIFRICPKMLQFLTYLLLKLESQ